MELWSTVEKEKAAKRERAAARLRPSRDGPPAGKVPPPLPGGTWPPPDGADADEALLPLTSAAAMEGGGSVAHGGDAGPGGEEAGGQLTQRAVADVPAPMTPQAEPGRQLSHHQYAAVRGPAEGEDESPEGCAPQQEPDLALERARLQPVSTGAPAEVPPAASAAGGQAGDGEAGTAAGEALQPAGIRCSTGAVGTAGSLWRVMSSQCRAWHSV